MEDDGKNENVEKNLPRQLITSVFNVCVILQSFWVRCRSILPNVTNRKFMEGELRIVWYCGIIFWTIYLLSKII
jgi:hypothetical protein